MVKKKASDDGERMVNEKKHAREEERHPSSFGLYGRKHGKLIVFLYLKDKTEGTT